MVSSENIFNRIISVDTLLALDGIIPSLPDFQKKTVLLVEQLYHALRKELVEEVLIEPLCKAICIYIDKRIALSVNGQFVSWNDYALEHYFYGYDNDDTSLNSQLSILLASSCTKTHRYALRLLSMHYHLSGTNEPLQDLLEKYSVIQPSHALSAEPVAQKTEPYSQAVFIIGPYAKKWFSSAIDNDAVRYDNGTVWLLASDCQEMNARVAKIASEFPATRIMAFFPLLPDGHDTSTTLHSRLSAWYNSYSTLRLTEPLPCIFGIYGRFSEEHIAHDPDRAVWVGELNNAFSPLSFSEGLCKINRILQAKDSGHNPFVMQRKVMAKALTIWLEETTLSQMIQQIFTLLPITLNSVMLCDHHSGFVRHGAWSRWLEEKFGVLPGLSAQLTLPSLPIIPSLLVGATLPVLANQPPETRPAKRGRKVVMAVVLLMLLALLTLALPESTRKALYKNWKRMTAATLYNTSAAPDMTALTISAFPTAIATLTPEQEQELMMLLPTITKSNVATFLIIGYSDNVGSAVRNLRISELRALSVRNWLIENSKMSAERFIIRGVGDTNPLVSNDRASNRAINRRVEIIPLVTDINQPSSVSKEQKNDNVFSF